MRSGSGPADSVSEIYVNHQDWLVKWLCRKLNCSYHAADLAQDTFVRLLSRGERFSAADLREPRAYLRVVAGGLVIDHFRRKDLEKAYLEALAALPEPTSISPEERELILETLQRIDAMLDRLPAKIRQAFLMSQIDGLTYAEIAAHMDISVRTVKRYMQQGFCQCLAILI